MQLLTSLVSAFLFLLFDHSWRISNATLMLSGPRGGTTPGILTLHGLQLVIGKRNDCTTSPSQSWSMTLAQPCLPTQCLYQSGLRTTLGFSVSSTVRRYQRPIATCGLPHSFQLSHLSHSCLKPVPHLWDSNPQSLAPATTGLPVPPLRECSSPPELLPVLVSDRSPCPRLLSYLWHVLAYPHHPDMVPSTMQTMTFCTISTASRCSSGMQVQPARIRHKFYQKCVADFMWSSSEKQVTMPRLSQISPFRTLAAQTLLSCSTRTWLSLMLSSLLSTNPPPARHVEGGCTGCSWTVTPPSCGHLLLCPPSHVVAKKRDASTSPLQALHAHMLQHNVDFIGGDFNMSAYPTVDHVFADQEFAAPGSSLLCGLGALTDTEQECTGFLIMPKRPYEERTDCNKYDNAELGAWTPGLLGSLPRFPPSPHHQPTWPRQHYAQRTSSAKTA